MANEPVEHSDFESFWNHFLSSHQHPAVRWCHVAALACGVVGLAASVKQRRLAPVLIGGGAFAALAIFSHPIFANNWPENFGNPRWATRAFVRLAVGTISGKIPSHS